MLPFQDQSQLNFGCKEKQISEWIKKLAERYSEVNINESKILIPEEIPTAERNAYMGAAAAAHKAGKSHFTFNGKKHPVTMKKDTATAIADQKESKKPMGEEEEVVMNPKKDKKEKKDANAEAEMAAEGVMDKVRDVRRKVFGKSDAEKRAEAERSAMSGFHKAMGKAADHAPSAMGAAIKKKKNESVEQVDEISKDKVGRYIKKAMVSTSDAGMDTASQDKDIRKRGINTFVKRRMGASDAVRKLTGKARVPATESTIPTIYSRILEERAKHYKSATKPEDWNEKEKNNKGAMDMKKDMAVDDSGKISNYDDLGHDDAAKAGRATNAAKTRPGDNAAGDKKIVNPVKGATN